MSRFDDPDDPMVVIVILGMVFGFVPFIVLAGTAPLIAALLVFSLVLLGVFLYLRSDTSDNNEKTTREQDSLAVLKERYARGEISEEEFEHRVTMLLDVDEIAGSSQESELVAERN